MLAGVARSGIRIPAERNHPVLAHDPRLEVTGVEVALLGLLRVQQVEVVVGGHLFAVPHLDNVPVRERPFLSL